MTNTKLQLGELSQEYVDMSAKRIEAVQDKTALIDGCEMMEIGNVDD